MGRTFSKHCTWSTVKEWMGQSAGFLNSVHSLQRNWTLTKTKYEEILSSRSTTWHSNGDCHHQEDTEVAHNTEVAHHTETCHLLAMTTCLHLVTEVCHHLDMEAC